MSLDIPSRISSKVVTINVDSDQKKEVRVFHAPFDVLGGSEFMLDRDVASVFQVKTSQMNQAKKRNPERFPNGFCESLNQELSKKLLELTGADSRSLGRGASVTVYSQLGVNMLASILSTPSAITASVEISKAFAAYQVMTGTTHMSVARDAVSANILELEGAIERIVLRILEGMSLSTSPQKHAQLSPEFPPPTGRTDVPIDRLIAQRMEAGLRYHLMLDVGENPSPEDRSKLWARVDRRFLAAHKVRLRVRRDNYNQRRSQKPRGERGPRWSRVDVSRSLGMGQLLYNVICEVLPLPKPRRSAAHVTHDELTDSLSGFKFSDNTYKAHPYPAN